MAITATQLESPGTHKRRGRLALSIVLVLIGIVLAPLSVLAIGAKDTVSNTDSFVETFAPLAEEPEFKTVVVDIAVGAIGQGLDSSAAASWAQDQLNSLELSNRLQVPLERLLDQVPGQVEEQVRALLMGWVDSEQFRTVWEMVLRGGHRQFVAILEQDSRALITAGSGGDAELQIWPVMPTLLAEQNQRLTDFITAIPNFTYAVSVGEGDSLEQGTKWYSAVVRAGTWLSWASVAFVFLGVAFATDRSRTLIRSGIAVAVLMALLNLALWLTPSAVSRSLANPPLSEDVWALILDKAIAQTMTTGFLVGAGALVVAGGVWGISNLTKRR